MYSTVTPAYRACVHPRWHRGTAQQREDVQDKSGYANAAER